MKPEILFEDAWLIVIDKPAGMGVHRPGTGRQETVPDWMEKKLRSIGACKLRPGH